MAVMLLLGVDRGMLTLVAIAAITLSSIHSMNRTPRTIRRTSALEFRAFTALYPL